MDARLPSIDKVPFFGRRPVQIKVPLSGEGAARGTGAGGAVRLGGGGITGKLPITGIGCDAILSIGGGRRSIGAGSRLLGTAASEKMRGGTFLGLARLSVLNSSTVSFSSPIGTSFSSGFGAASAASRIR